MSSCNHNLNNDNNTINLSKKFLGVYPRTYSGYCCECKKIFKFVKENNVYKEVT